MSGCPEAPAGCGAVLGWEHGPWDVAASPDYVACDKSGLARSAELRCGLACCAWAVASTFRKEERGERVRVLSLPVAAHPACPPLGWLGAARAISRWWKAPARGCSLHPSTSRQLLASAQSWLLLLGLEVERETS